MSLRTISSFAGFLADASYQSPTTNQIPSVITRSPLGDTIGLALLQVRSALVNYCLGKPLPRW